MYVISIDGYHSRIALITTAYISKPFKQNPAQSNANTIQIIKNKYLNSLPLCVFVKRVSVSVKIGKTRNSMRLLAIQNVFATENKTKICANWLKIDRKKEKL